MLDDLKVRLQTADRRHDGEIRGAAVQTLIWDVNVPSDAIDVNVSDGWVTLKGEADYQYQSDAADCDVASLCVAGMTNEIKVIAPEPESGSGPIG